MKRVVALLLIACPVWAGGWAKRIWRVSAAVLVAASAADAATSYGRYEGNPVLRGQDGRFGARGIALKGAIAGAAIAIEYAWERKRPEDRAYRISTVCNFATAATMGAFAYRNTTIPAPK